LAVYDSQALSHSTNSETKQRNESGRPPKGFSLRSAGARKGADRLRRKKTVVGGCQQANRPWSGNCFNCCVWMGLSAPVIAEEIGDLTH
jgi:hypothetical protein